MAQSGTHAPRDACALVGRDFAARNSGKNARQQAPAILRSVQRRQVEPEALRRVDIRERRRQELPGERPQQMGLAVDEIRQRLRAQPPSGGIGHPPPRIADAERPAARIARAPLRETPARVTQHTQPDIRIKPLKFPDMRPGSSGAKAARQQSPASKALRSG
jgi:hypothetical protein